MKLYPATRELQCRSGDPHGVQDIQQCFHPLRTRLNCANVKIKGQIVLPVRIVTLTQVLCIAREDHIVRTISDGNIEPARKSREFIHIYRKPVGLAVVVFDDFTQEVIAEQLRAEGRIACSVK